MNGYPDELLRREAEAWRRLNEARAAFREARAAWLGVLAEMDSYYTENTTRKAEP
jgi:hypothetical protein